MENLEKTLLFSLIPLAAMLLGGVAAAFRPPGAKLRSSVQHFAAGLLFAAIGGELLPQIMHPATPFAGAPVAAAAGFALGVAVMLGVKHLTTAYGAKNIGESAQPTSLLATLGVDVFIDGLLIGVSFAAGEKQGFLLTIALSVEALFLGLSAAAALSKAAASRGKIVRTVSLLAVLLVAGAGVGAALLGGLTGAWLEAVLSFGAAALLYLVTEELLVEAHEEPETPLLTAMFFVGFLALLIVEMVA